LPSTLFQALFKGLPAGAYNTASYFGLLLYDLQWHGAMVALNDVLLVY
jgi:hypothetical protein